MLLADELVERPRAQPLRERRDLAHPLRGRVAKEIAHAAQYAPRPWPTRHSLRDEVVELLQRLIRLDTTNPPGNETRAAELLRAYLERTGVACELYARTPERANLVARIPGTGGGPSPAAALAHRRRSAPTRTSGRATRSVGRPARTATSGAAARST